MTAPSLIQDEATVFNTTTSPKTTANWTTAAGDILVGGIMVEGSAGAEYTFTIGGNSLTYTPRNDTDLTDYGVETDWTAPETGSGTFGLTFTRTAGDPARWWGGAGWQFRGSDGVGNVLDGNSNTGDPTLSFTTTQDDSAIVMLVVDWNAADYGAGPTYYTAGAGSFTELFKFRDSSHYTVYMGCYANAGAAATKTIGIDLPAGMKWTIAAVEVKGTAAGGGSILPLVAKDMAHMDDMKDMRG